MYPKLFIYSLVDAYLVYSQLLTIINKAAMNICIKVCVNTSFRKKIQE